MTITATTMTPLEVLAAFDKTIQIEEKAGGNL